LARELRPAFSALWNLDLAFADVVSTSTDPHLGAIRLAWWRERLEELDRGEMAPAEPRLQAAASELLPRGVTGNELSQLEDAWLPALELFPWGKAQVEGLALRGRILFGIGAKLLGGESTAAEPAGGFWSLADGAAHCSDPESRQLLLNDAQSALADIPKSLPRQLRPMTVLSALAAAELGRKSSGFSRVSAAVRHRLFGTTPRS
jgi:phytoene synthase